MIPPLLYCQALGLDSFLGVFLDATPRLDNVKDDRRYSQVLADFPIVGVVFSSIVLFSKKSIWLFGRAFCGSDGALANSQKALFIYKNLYKITHPLFATCKFCLFSVNVSDDSWHWRSVGHEPGVQKLSLFMVYLVRPKKTAFFAEGEEGEQPRYLLNVFHILQRTDFAANCRWYFFIYSICVKKGLLSNIFSVNGHVSWRRTVKDTSWR